MKTKKFKTTGGVGKFVSAVLCAMCASTCFAGPIEVESGDAGQLTGSAQGFAGSGAITAIQGGLTGGNDMADMFRLYLSAGQAFYATTTASGLAFNNFDTSLFLFDSSGHGLVANDDDPNVGPTSTINGFIPTVTGYYYLAIAGTGYIPVSPGGAIFGDLLGGDQVGPSGAGGALGLSSWVSLTSEGDAYEIILRGAAAGPDDVTSVPEPASLSMLMLGLGSCALLRRRASRRGRRAA